MAARGPWHAFGLVVACALAVVLTFLPSFAEMVRIWYRSGTFAHAFFVFPAFLYFVWQKRSLLAATPVQPFLPAVALVAGAGSFWLLGELASALTPSFLGAVAMVPALVLGILGWRWARVLSFPLVFLFFAVPFGEAFVPKMMEWTADFTVAALQGTGVPVLREGQNLTIPTGHWSVVEACSGIRYLIASMFVGALYAWTVYRSPLRRLVFFGASIVVPIVANWLRAFMIVMLGHLSGNRLAAGVDHLIYGWVFFGGVVFVLFAVGAIWREDDRATSSDAVFTKAKAIGATPFARGAVARAAAVMVVAMLVWPAAGMVLVRPYEARKLPAAVFHGAAGWKIVDGPLVEWQPQLQGATSEQNFTFEKDGHKIGLFVGFFRDQRQGAELVNSMNTLVRSDDRRWTAIDGGARTVELEGQALTVQTKRVRGEGGTLVAWQWYWLGDSWTSSDLVAKIHAALDRLLRRDDTSAWVAVYVFDSGEAANADRILDGFVRDAGGALGIALRSVAGQ